MDFNLFRKLQHTEMAGFVNIFTEDGAESRWVAYWCVLIKSNLIVHKSPQHEPFFIIDIFGSIISKKWKNSLQIDVVSNSKSYFFHCVNTAELQQWETALGYASTGK